VNASSSSAQHALAPALREPVLVRAALIAVALAFFAENESQASGR